MRSTATRPRPARSSSTPSSSVSCSAIARERRDLLAWRPPRRAGCRALGLALATLLVAGLVISLIDQFFHGGREQGVVPRSLAGRAHAARTSPTGSSSPASRRSSRRRPTAGSATRLLAAHWGVAAAIFGSAPPSPSATASSRRCPSSRSSASRSPGCARASTASSPACSCTARSTASRWRRSSSEPAATSSSSSTSASASAKSSAETRSRNFLNSSTMSSSLRLALELDRGLLDHLVGRVDRHLGPHRDRDRVGRAGVDLDLGAVVDAR